MKNDIKNKINGDCFPIFANFGVAARINFENTSYLHYFKNSVDKEFYYFIRLFSKAPYFFEDGTEENIYVLGIHLYNYNDIGVRTDVINDMDFFDSIEEVFDSIIPIFSSFLPHHRFILSFDGSEKYSFSEFQETVKLWREETLST